ncbi:disease resistance protein RPV1 [Hevea brasiliensis]|uniref:disease resistance protein RPV1 n=1 Tax=Hevea brasiliensis TaxID=3981 RepID=UPI0025D32468|nr:disease resistance protein RPV1 [Hevea brasiliensis]XP_058007333.1 disease resistance protein RPV1 [Hevea brasiliensis]XP_058007334.1 disease resistance protein RPV1 [Hevea brasiliensis]
MASSSSSLITFQSKKYDVFISFRGADIRDGFLSHLQEALLQNEVNTFVDEKLDRGEEISSSLLEIIEQSYFSLVIFSENYAYSPWCLEELVKILECMKDMEQMVLPVFYCIDPTHVQELTGSFGAALAKHREVFNNSLDKVESWCQALREIAGIAGLVSHNIKPDSKLIEEIVNHILKKLNDLFPSDFYYEGLVGIDSRINNAKSLLYLESMEVRVLGIWGMGGIGKTTIALKLFGRISGQFNIRCFVANVREKYEKGGPDAILQEILFQALGRETYNLGVPIVLSFSIRERLSREKVLIALDDVSDLEQIELSIGKPAIYGPGSKFIITSRDKQLLRNMGAQIYEVEKLSYCEASWLFRFHAFKQDIVGKEYMMLSKNAVEYAQGIPLAIKVLGSNLYSRRVKEWADELEKLESTSDEKIQRILKLTYDALSVHDKENFLDIVCFFKGEDKDHVENTLGTPGSIIGISRLADMSLISTANNKLHIHDLLQQMGKDIICEEKQLGQRSRLWHPKDIYYLLTRAEGTGANRGISLDMSKIREVELSPTVFERMYNLKFLKFYCSVHPQNRVNLSEGLKFLPNELRLLHWYGYPLKSLPLSSCAENLVDLCLTNSKIKELWDGVQHLPNLKYVDLSFSKDLVRLPDLSRCSNLEVLNLHACSGLVEVTSLKYLSKLTFLDLKWCISLCTLPSLLHLKSLKVLSIAYCLKIIEFPEFPEQVPSSIGCLSHLSRLDLNCLTGLESLPDSIGNLKSLREFGIFDCVNLKELPENLGNLESLEKLFVNDSAIKKLPDNICNLKRLAELSVEKCVNLLALPANLGNLESLKRLLAGGTGIKELPESICNLKNLTNLLVEKCVNLQSLPENFGNLESLVELFVNGSAIKELPDSICNLKNLVKLSVWKCVNLLGLPAKLGNLESLKRLLAGGTGMKELPVSICNLKNLTKLSVGKCVNLQSLPENFGNLESLEELGAHGTGIKELPDSFGYLKELRIINISQCVVLHGLPESFGNLESLDCVMASGAGIKRLPSFINRLRNLRTLNFRGCEGLIIPALTVFPFLEVVNLGLCGLLEFPNTLCHIVSLKQLYVDGNNFEKMPDTIKKLSRLVELDLSDCKRLKYLPELPSLSILSAKNCTSLESASSLFQLYSIEAVEFGNCINLDGDECSKIVDHLLATPWRRQVAFCFPGSEVPQWIKYQNDCGSSFFLSFRQLEQMKSTYFTFCVVFDPKVCPHHFKRIGCTVHFINDSGHSQYQFDHYFLFGRYRPDMDKLVLHSEHIFFWHSFLKFRQNSMVFQFFVDINKRRTYNAIAKCGIHLKRLKHGKEQPPNVTFKALRGGHDFLFDINTLTH